MQSFNTSEWELHWHNYIEPSYSSLDPNYNTVTTILWPQAMKELEIMMSLNKKQKLKPANPPPVKVEASKSEDEFFNTEVHMYTCSRQ